MRAVVQRVNQGQVLVEEKAVGQIAKGLVVLLGVERSDKPEDIKYIADKTANLRIFPDEEGKMNLSVKDIGGGVLVVSQFTLLGDCRKGRRPSFFEAADPEIAEEYYQKFKEELENNGLNVASGEFQAMMEVQIFNDGPVTILLDSKKCF